MSDEIRGWSFGLLFATTSVLLGIIGVASARKPIERGFASGLFLQGVILIFVVSGAYFHRSTSLYLGGLAVVGLLIVQTLFGSSSVADENAFGEDESQ